VQRDREDLGHGRVWPLISIHDAPEDEATRQHLGRFERAAATPAMAAAANRFSHRSEDPLVPAGMGRYLADNIHDARYLELPGAFHFSATGKDEEVLGEIEEFLTGARVIGEVDRVLKTVLFTDIANSTERAVELGDRRWREVPTRTTPSCVRSSRTIAARRSCVVGLADPGEILVTSTVRDLVTGQTSASTRAAGTR